MVRIQGILLGVLLLLTACTATPSGAPQLDGTSWIVSDIAGQATMRGQQPTLTFTNGRVSGSTGCNTVSGAYTQSGDGVTFSPMAVTEIGCPEPAMAQQTAFLAALTKVARASGDATSVLFQDAAGKTLLRLTAPPMPSPSPLTKTRWSLTSLSTGTSVQSPVAAGAVTLTVDTEGGSYFGSACNNFGGDVTVDGDSITFGTAHTTKMACPADELDQEGQVLSLLPQVTTWLVDGDTLTLSAPDGTLRFVAS